MTTLVPERRKGDLPAEVTTFIGRRRELSQVRDALERYRPVTSRGVGGVGKTRLALHLAAGLQRSFADGVWLAELSALRNAELLARPAWACQTRPQAIRWMCWRTTWPNGISLTNPARRLGHPPGRQLRRLRWFIRSADAPT